MSVCGQNGQADEDSGSEEVTAGTSTVRELYKQKPASKVVRVLTVLAYLLSVSLAAILLSVYYVCVWKSPDLPPLNDTDPAASRLSAPRPLPPNYATPATSRHNATGGGDSAINDLAEPTPIPTSNSIENASATTYENPDFAPDSSAPTLEPSDNTTSYPSTEDFNGTTSIT